MGQVDAAGRQLALGAAEEGGSRTSATTGLVFLSRRPSSLYSRKPLNSAVQERSRNSTKILRAGPCSESSELSALQSSGAACW